MAQSFQQLGVSADLIKGLDELGIKEPTPIQRRAIPFLLDDGGDLIAQAQTGTGKTAAFGLPLLAKIDPTQDQVQGLIIAPTRELAKQIGKQLFKYTKYCEQKIFVEVAAGGDKIEIQAERLERPTHIVVATPGRLMDLLEMDALSLESVNHLILDEADEMLSMGFKDELAKVIKLTEWRRSLWLFSATFQAKIRQLIEGSMSPQAHRIKVEKADVVNPNIDHRFVICERDEKDEFIVQYLSRLDAERGLIFCRTKQGAIRMGQVLTEAGFAVGVIQGDLSQKDRDKVMRAFKKERIQHLIATDVAARGIDVEGLAFVIHHQLPDQMQYYTHRSGRTARAGKTGESICLIEPQQRRDLNRMESELGIRFSLID